MSKSYRSKPHEISAFKFEGNNTNYPEWFNEFIYKGGASVTINKKSSHITVYGREQEEKAFEGDWICLSRHKKAYVLENKAFKSYYEEIK